MPEDRQRAPADAGVLQEFLNSAQLGGAPGIGEEIATEVRKRHDDGESQAAIATSTQLERSLVAALIRGVPVVDALSTAERATAWCMANGVPVGRRVDGEDLSRLRVLRGALRELAMANAGAKYDNEAHDVLDRLARSESTKLRYSVDEGPHVETSTVTGWILAVAFDAMRDGTWGRLKRCTGDGCPHVFYDASKNRSGAWCAMAVCGNRRKVRAYQQRRRARNAN